MAAAEHYVYFHRRATDDAIFYVGKGKGRRAWSASGRNRQWQFVQRKHGYKVQIVKSDMSEPCALTLERILIFGLGRPLLVNSVDGGGGTTGWRHSEETKMRIGAFNKGKKASLKALEALDRFRFQPRTAEWRSNMSAAAKARKGRAHSAETRAKIAASHIGIKPSRETLEKMRASHLGKVGRLSPSYDHATRVFEHPTRGTFTGTRGDFICAFGLGNSCVSMLIQGKRKTVKGWRVK